MESLVLRKMKIQEENADWHLGIQPCYFTIPPIALGSSDWSTSSAILLLSVNHLTPFLQILLVG